MAEPLSLSLKTGLAATFRAFISACRASSVGFRVGIKRGTAAAEAKRVAVAAAAERTRRLAEVEKVFAARDAVARDLFYEYHRVKDAPVPTHHTRARTCAEIKEQYLAARGFDPRSTVELDGHGQPSFRLNGYTREAWARATDELDTNAQARHEMYIAEAKAARG
jgi:hypothetical protein